MRYFIILLLVLMNLSWAAPANANPPINVIYYHHAKPDALDRASAAVWAAAAKTLNINYLLVPMTNLDQAMNTLKNHRAEFVIGPLIPQLQNQSINYLNTYIPNKLGVLINTDSKLNPLEKFWYLLKAFVGFSFAILILYMLIFSALIWFVERKGSKATFPRNPIAGIACAFWFTVTTFTTLGYGDYVPKTSLGRGITIAWIFISLILGSTFIATMSSEVTTLELRANSINSSSQLQGQIIAYLKGDTFALNSIHRIKGIALACIDWHTLIKAVRDKKAQAALANDILLREALTLHPDSEVQLANFSIDNGSFAFATRYDNPHPSELPYVLYTLETTGQINQLINNAINS